jgi:hypothetical protein
MKAEMYMDYVCYNVESFFKQKPEGPCQCSVCRGHLSISDIETSRAMHDEIECSEKSQYYLVYASSLLFTCDACSWWCVREHYEFSCPGVGHRYGYDYVIWSTADSSGHEVPMNVPDSTRPWQRALCDPRVYDHLQSLPRELANLFQGGITREQTDDA